MREPMKKAGARAGVGDRDSSVPPGAFNPRMVLAGLAPELLVHRNSDGNRQSVSFWEKSCGRMGGIYEVASSLPLGPTITAWSRGEVPLAIGTARLSLAVVSPRAAVSGVNSSKRRSWQPVGASSDGCIVSALHSMKKGSRPLESSFKARVDQ